MAQDRDQAPAGPALADQVTRLYDLIAGYHLTNLLEVGRELRVWEAVAKRPGIDSAALADALKADSECIDILCRTAFSFEILEREGDGWKMGPHLDAILGDPDSPFYLGRAATVHLLLGGEEYPDMADRIRRGRVVPYSDHSDAFINEVADSLRSLPRIFVNVVLPRLPSLGQRLASGARVLDLGCGAGWAIVELAERFPASRVEGADVEPRSVELAADRIARLGLADRCTARLLGPEGLIDVATYDVITTFLVIHEIEPDLKDDVIAAAARALTPGGSLVIFDEAYPDTDEAMRTMPSRFTAVAQWYELTWGNRIDTAAALRDRSCAPGFGWPTRRSSAGSRSSSRRSRARETERLARDQRAGFRDPCRARRRRQGPVDASSIVMTTLPRARPSSTQRSASAISLSGYRRSITGLTWPAAMSPFSVSTSSGSNGFHHSIRPVHRLVASETTGPTIRAATIAGVVPPSVT